MYRQMIVNDTTPFLEVMALEIHRNFFLSNSNIIGVGRLAGKKKYFTKSSRYPSNEIGRTEIDLPRPWHHGMKLVHPKVE